jgi:hypothetical protein
MKETAVEWLEKIRHGQKGQPFDDYEWEIAFNHAKEIEKQQICEAYAIGGSPLLGPWEFGEEYYDETFKSE